MMHLLKSNLLPNTPPVDVTGVTVAPKTNNLVVGATRQLTATVEPGDADNQSVTFVSDDDAVASVDGTGLVTANAEGTVTITVTTDDGGHTDTATISVTEPETSEDD